MKMTNAFSFVLFVGISTLLTSSTAKPIDVSALADSHDDWFQQFEEELKRDPQKKALFAEHMRRYYDQVDVFHKNGIRDFKCDVTVGGRSASVPTTVNALRPGDIDIVAALGDSLTAGNGARAITLAGVLTQYRGQVFTIGGSEDLSKHITVSNVLKKYNSALNGFSVGLGTWRDYLASRMNVGVPGSKAPDMPDQAKALVDRFRKHLSVAEFENSWKMVYLFVGGNDMCAYCRHPDTYSPANYAGHIREAIKTIHDSVPRVLFNVMGTFHLEMLRQITENEKGCQLIHRWECPCSTPVESFSDEQFSQLSYSYRDALHAMVNKAEFEKDDFTVVIQTFAEETIVPPKTPSGKPDLTFFAPDCFHFSSKGHDKVAQGVWMNMLEPVGHKTTQLNLTVTTPHLNCPPEDCPFIRTLANSKDCKKYLGRK